MTNISIDTSFKCKRKIKTVYLDQNIWSLIAKCKLYPEKYCDLIPIVNDLYDKAETAKIDNNAGKNL